MNFAPRYLGRGSWLARRDPRVLVIAVVCFVLAAIQVWDLRIMLILDLIAFAYYRTARIPFRQVRRQWMLAILFVSLLVFANGIIASGRIQRLPEGVEPHIYGYIPLLGTPVSAESLTFALVQFLRFLSLIAVGFPIAFAIAPDVFGVTFARLGVPYRFAYAIDLTWRFIPSLAEDFRSTIDAQRVRGMDFTGQSRNPVARVRRQIPVLVPTIVNAIAGAEDTIDAMDLRGFGTGERTWFQDLVLDRTDKLVLIGFGSLLVVATIGGLVTSSSVLWVPDAILPR
ncbi:MAG: energy-coupling factor transporter transmembrane protein EcfT [Chloroflexota bacterium]|nr:MAG: energy-coupling factor transporter transmembrane protein EcfT [Chloroflexota bacterium]